MESKCLLWMMAGFGKRDDDNSGLGDWFVNEEKLGCSLSEFVNQINKIGLKFGLWFELEMVSEDSCLYREHQSGVLQFQGENHLEEEISWYLIWEERMCKNTLKMLF